MFLFAVTHLSGQARLHFTRHPYTHWSFSFFGDPVLELQVESQFQGRPLPQITSIIVSQVVSLFTFNTLTEAGHFFYTGQSEHLLHCTRSKNLTNQSYGSHPIVFTIKQTTFVYVHRLLPLLD
jgi:hypothetical protein